MKNKIIVIAFAFLSMLFMTSCEEELGCMGNSYWTTYETHRETPYRTLEFSGLNTCRYRNHITDLIDIDYDLDYFEESDGSISLYDDEEFFASIILEGDGMLVFVQDSKGTLFYRH